MVDTLTRETEDRKWLVGIPKESSLHQLLNTSFLASVRVMSINGEEDVSGLDALIASYADASKLPRAYTTPIILLGTQGERSLLPQFSVSAVVSQDYSLEIGQRALPETLEQTIRELSSRSGYTRNVRGFFPELVVDWTDITERLIKGGGGAESFFDAYYQICMEHVSHFFDQVKNTGDPDGIKKLYKFFVKTNRDEELDELIKTTGNIGLLSGAMRLIEDPNARQFVPLIIKSLTLAAPFLKETPYLVRLERNTHFVFKIPSKDAFYLKLALENPEQLRQETKVIQLFQEQMKSKYFREHPELGPDFLSMPQLKFVPPSRLNDKLEQWGFYCFALRELPGEKAVDLLYALEQQEKESRVNTNMIRAKLEDAQKSPEEQQSLQGELLKLNEIDATARAQLQAIKGVIVEETARAEALGYILSKTDAGQSLIQPPIARSSEDYWNYLRNGFFGDEDAVVKGRHARGIRQIEKQLKNEHALSEINVFLDSIKDDVTPVLDVMVESPSGIDLDRSIINMILQMNENKLVRAHQLDFEIMRSEPMLHAFAKTELLLSRYGNDMVKIDENIPYHRNPTMMLVEKGDEVHGYKMRLAQFVNAFSKHYDTIKDVIARQKPGMRLRWPLPDSREELHDQFHAFSAYRGMLYFGYFERCKEEQPQRGQVFNHYQDLAVENAMHSIFELAERAKGTSREERLGRLHKTVQELHDRYLLWRTE